MILYDGKSDIDWFYNNHPTTAEGMANDPRVADLTKAPCVLFDDGNGRVYRWMRLDALCARWGVELAEDAKVGSEEAKAALDSVVEAMQVVPEDVGVKVDELTQKYADLSDALAKLSEAQVTLTEFMAKAKALLKIN